MNQTGKRCVITAVLAIAAALPQFRHLSLSEGGLQLIADAEGCRTVPYQCSAGVWTNGIGHTAGVTPHSRVSERQVAVNLLTDLTRVEEGLRQCMPQTVPQPVYDAVVSFAFNVGVRAACESTLVGLLHQGEWRRACQQLPRWVFVNGIRNRGLENRRARELAWCLQGSS